MSIGEEESAQLNGGNLGLYIGSFNCFYERILDSGLDIFYFTQGSLNHFVTLDRLLEREELNGRSFTPNKEDILRLSLLLRDSIIPRSQIPSISLNRYMGISPRTPTINMLTVLSSEGHYTF
jgi:hypothetical protein